MAPVLGSLLCLKDTWLVFLALGFSLIQHLLLQVFGQWAGRFFSCSLLLLSNKHFARSQSSEMNITVLHFLFGCPCLLVHIIHLSVLSLACPIYYYVFVISFGLTRPSRTPSKGIVCSASSLVGLCLSAVTSVGCILSEFSASWNANSLLQWNGTGLIRLLPGLEIFAN